MTSQQLIERASKAVQQQEQDLPPVWSSERAPSAVNNEARKRAKEFVDRINPMRTLLSLLEDAQVQFDKESVMKNTELRLAAYNSFMAISNKDMRPFARVFADRISVFEMTQRKQHIGTYDALGTAIVAKLIHSALINQHQGEAFFENLIKVLKSGDLKKVKFDLELKYNKISDDKILKQARLDEAKEQKEQEQRVIDFEFRTKMNKALALKKRVDQENELLAWLEDNQIKTA